MQCIQKRPLDTRHFHKSLSDKMHKKAYEKWKSIKFPTKIALSRRAKVKLTDLIKHIHIRYNEVKQQRKAAKCFYKEKRIF